MGVTSLGRHIRPACYQALLWRFVQKNYVKYVDLTLVCVCSLPHGVT